MAAQLVPHVAFIFRNRQGRLVPPRVGGLSFTTRTGMNADRLMF